MKVSFVAALLWTASFALEAALLFVLFYRQRRRAVPWFTVWISFQMISSLTCFAMLHLGTRELYRDVYWSCAFIEFALQIAVILEIAASVLRRSGRWVDGARTRFAVGATVASTAALAMAWFMTPATETALDAWDARVSLFTTLFVCLLFTSIMAASQQLGLAWRSHVMREGYGMMIWVLVAFITDTLHAYWRTAESFTALEQGFMVFFLGSLSYWIIAFWLPEKVTEVPSSDMLERMKALGLPIHTVERELSRTDEVVRR